MIYLLTLVLAFCSIVYELLLGQMLSAFLGNTVLRYSVTIGLYMLSMGIGALAARRRVVERPVLMLQRVEIGLSVAGASSILLLFALDWAGLPRPLFSVVAHGLIVLIGLLTGLEIPLLMAIRRREAEDAEAAVLGVDYFGAFLGTVLFAFLFYPRLGLVPTAFLIAALNALVGVLLVTQAGKVPREARTRHVGLALAQAGLLALLVVGLGNAAAINEFCLAHYLHAAEVASRG
jgi:spermidine synthase